MHASAFLAFSGSLILVIGALWWVLRR